MRHILRAQQFDRSFLEKLFRRAGEFQKLLADPMTRRLAAETLKGRMLFNIFYLYILKENFTAQPLLEKRGKLLFPRKREKI